MDIKLTEAPGDIAGLPEFPRLATLKLDVSELNTGEGLEGQE